MQSVQDLATAVQRVIGNVEKVIVGKGETVAFSLIAVICHGPWLLVSAGLVRGRSMTSYHTIQDDLKNAGADWRDAEVVRDRNWVSSRKPDDLAAFNREMLALFSEHYAGRTARAA